MAISTTSASGLVQGGASGGNIRYPLRITKSTVCDGEKVFPGDEVNASSLLLLRIGKAEKAGDPFIWKGEPVIRKRFIKDEKKKPENRQVPEESIVTRD